MSDPVAVKTYIVAAVGTSFAGLGLFLFISEPGRDLLKKIIYNLWSFITKLIFRKKFGWGDEFAWATVDEAPLHVPEVFGCHEPIVHIKAKECWQRLFSNQFSQSWPNRRRMVIKKPLQVRLCSTFLRTDTSVLLSFFLCSASGPRSNFSADLRPRARRYRLTSHTVTLRLWRDGLDGPFSGHLEGSSRGCLRRFSKTECNEMLHRGNQPYYRDNVPLRNFTLHFPDWDRDFERGGWIALVGLSVLEPAPVYIGQTDAFGQDRERYIVSCRYVLKVIQEKIKSNIPTTPAIETAIMALEYMNGQTSGSGLPPKLSNTPLQDLHVQDTYTSNLTFVECNFIIDLFSSMDALSTNQVLSLRHLSTPAVAAVVRGVWKVYLYLQNDGYGLGAPIQDLFRNNETVYLVDC